MDFESRRIALDQGHCEMAVNNPASIAPISVPTLLCA